MSIILLSDMPQGVIYLCVISRPIVKKNKRWNMPFESVSLSLLNVSYKIDEKCFNGISVSDVFKQGQVAG